MWNLRCQPLLRALRLSRGTDPGGGLPPDELDELVRAAFPRPAAPPALRERVREQLVSRALARGRARRLVLAGAVSVLIVAAALSTGRRHGAALAENAAPGQLTVLDRDGRPAGLCPLRHTDVTATITGFVARVDVRQEFVNRERAPVEAVYTFPLPGDAAVDAMTMHVGERVIRGEVKPRAEAARMYEAARSEGRAAALLEQERPNIFTQSVANIMPGDRVTIAISYVQMLAYQGGSYEFVFPMVVGPRYMPGGGGYTTPGRRGLPGSSGGPVADAHRITPPIAPPGTRAGHDISVRVRLEAGMPLEQIVSELHAVRVERKGESAAEVVLSERKTLPNRDFILRYGTAGDAVRAGLLAQASDDGSGHFALVVQPPASQPRGEPREIVFVIDQSGSQSGWPMRKAKELMSFLVKSMNPEDTFQLLGFHSEVVPCFDAPVANTPENVARALAFLEPLTGNGGTELLPAVEFALRTGSAVGRRRIICFLTDGYVGNDTEILDYVRKRRERVHFFPVGIGDAPNRYLIDGLARVGSGEADYVTLQGSAEEAARRFYRRVAEPLLTGISVDWGGLEVVETFPRLIPDLFVGGRPIQLKGRYTRPGSGSVLVTGTLGGRAWMQRIDVTLPGPPGSRAAGIPTLWAREKIEQLMRGADDEGVLDAAARDQVQAVALEYRLVTRYTSFVAVGEQVVNPGGRQSTRDVPVELPSGMAYEGIFSGSEGRAPGGRTQSGAPPPTAAAPLPPRAGESRPESETDLAGGEPEQGAAPNRASDGPMPETVRPQAGTALSGSHPPAGSPPPPPSPAAPAIAPLTQAAPAAEVPPDGALGKLDAALRALARGGPAPPGVRVRNGRVDVRLLLADLPADGLRRLRETGFTATSTVEPGRAARGSVPIGSLEALAALEFVIRVEAAAAR